MNNDATSMAGAATPRAQSRASDAVARRELQRRRPQIPIRDLGVARPFPVTDQGFSAEAERQEREVAGSRINAKAVLDRVIAAVALVALSPLLALIAVAIRLESRGPVLFMQERHGQNLERFTIYKFRTMRQEGCQAKFTQATRGDARVTRLGRLLRKTSLDELPQLFNVIKGEMSLVGPRPHPIDLDRKYLSDLYAYSARYGVKPGITGWAQINGFRGPTEAEGSMEERLNCDLYYIQNWSIGLDLKILAMTPWAGIFGKNAF